MYHCVRNMFCSSSLRSPDMSPHKLELCNSATSSQWHDEEERDKFEVLVEWLKSGGAKMDHLMLQYYDTDYRGVHMKDDVEANKFILEIPKDFIMTTTLAKQSPIGKAILDSGVFLDSAHTFLACMLMYEKRQSQSFWKPYLDVLPKYYKNMPIFFSDDELVWLKGSIGIEKRLVQQDYLNRDYETLCTSVPTFYQMEPPPSLEEFIWARSAVITRIFGFYINGRKNDGLVPMADMLNHSLQKTTSWNYDDFRHAFVIMSTTALHQGAEVFDSYGAKCNSRFLVNYGFALTDNQADNEAIVRVYVDINDPKYSGRYVRCDECRSFQVGRNYNHRETQQYFNLDKVSSVSKVNESGALHSLVSHCKLALSMFDTSLEEDTDILRMRRDLTRNQRNCVILRHGEKEVLHTLIQLAETCLPLLEGGVTRSEVLTVITSTPDCSEYLQSAVLRLM